MCITPPVATRNFAVYKVAFFTRIALLNSLFDNSYIDMYAIFATDNIVKIPANPLVLGFDMAIRYGAGGCQGTG